MRDLARANSDLSNLLKSTQIATIFLDNDLRVRSFTPIATELFRLLESDVGRPIDHLGSRVEYPDLSDDVRKVLTKLGTSSVTYPRRTAVRTSRAFILIAASTISSPAQ